MSKWREILMGIGITGVLIAHFLRWNEVQSIVAYIFKPFVGLVFTEGFLLLSGLGLYYSFKKNGDIHSFYKKRIDRLFIPFLIISTPFYLERAITYHQSVGDFLLNITALHFWFEGNDGMWYISVSMLLYLIFPFIYKFIFKSNEQVALRGIGVVSLFLIVDAVVYFYFPSYYELTGIGLAQMPMYGIGILIGYLSYNSLNLKHEYIYITLLGVLAVITNIMDGFIGEYGNSALRLFCIVLLCPLFSWMDKVISNVFSWIKAFFGWFGRYTLELYTLHLFIYHLISRWLEPRWGGGNFYILINMLSPDHSKVNK